MRTRFTSIIPRAAMMLLVMLLTSVSAWADDSGNCGEEGDNVTYSYEESTHTLTISGTGAMGSEYPAPWYDYAGQIQTVVINDGVTAIGDYAFYECSALTSVTIPASVTTIGSEAFSECYSLASVTLPASVTTIGFEAFYKCSALTSVTIPASVTAIGAYAFEDCTSLTSVTISASVTTIEYGTFYNCASLTAITLPAGVTQISNYAFGSCSKLESVTFEDGSQLEDIGASAFSRTALTSFEIGSSVTSIGEGAFGNCEKLTTFNVKTGNECFKVEDYVLFSKDGKTLHTYPMGLPDDSYTIPDGVTTICGYAFYGCNLEDIIIPTTVTSIGEKAFDGTAWIANQPYEDGVLYANNIAIARNDDISGAVAIKDGTTMISPNCFNNCENLTAVTIPASVTTLGHAAFAFCQNLKTVTFAAGSKLTAIEVNAFYSCGLTSVNIPANVTTIGVGAFQECADLQTVTFEEGSKLTAIGVNAFYSCGLTSVNIPANVTTIGEGAFQDCADLQTVTFEEGSKLTAIEVNAFYGCGLTSVNIPASVTYIAYNAFDQCWNLAAVTLNSNPVMDTGVFPHDATVTMNLKLNGSGTDYWMPFYNQYYGFKADANTTVYKGAVKGNHVLLTAVDDIPAFNAVVLKSTASSITLTLSYDTTADDDFWDNDFWGTDADTDASEMASAYCLSQGKSGVGFYKYAGIIPANSTYFVIDDEDDSQPDYLPFKIAGLKGDANGDGDVTITDAVTIVDYILGNEPEDFVFEAADVNEDGEVNITDAVGVVDIILNSK